MHCLLMENDLGLAVAVAKLHLSDWPVLGGLGQRAQEAGRLTSSRRWASGTAT